MFIAQSKDCKFHGQEKQLSSLLNFILEKNLALFPFLW